jgi:hypothetical protein
MSLNTSMKMSSIPSPLICGVRRRVFSNVLKNACNLQQKSSVSDVTATITCFLIAIEKICVSFTFENIHISAEPSSNTAREKSIDYTSWEGTNDCQLTYTSDRSNDEEY